MDDIAYRLRQLSQVSSAMNECMIARINRILEERDDKQKCLNDVQQLLFEMKMSDRNRARLEELLTVFAMNLKKE